MQIQIETRPATNHRGPYGRTAKARLFIHHKEETVLENLTERDSRDHKSYRRDILPTVFRELKLPADTKCSWSQKAGCSSCPCSPGFVLEGTIGTTIWVTVVDDGKPEVTVVNG